MQGLRICNANANHATAALGRLLLPFARDTPSRTWTSKGTKKETVNLDLQKGPAAGTMRVRTGAVMGTFSSRALPPSMYLNSRCGGVVVVEGL